MTLNLPASPGLLPARLPRGRSRFLMAPFPGFLHLLRSPRTLILLMILSLTGLVLTTQAVASSAPSPLRLAEALRLDLRHHAGLPGSFRILVNRFEREGDLLRIWFSGREDRRTGLLLPVAIYEYHLPTRRVVRRDLTSLVRHFPKLKTEPAVVTAQPSSSPAPLSHAMNLPSHRVERAAGGLTIRGVLRNIPGYILEVADYKSRFQIWAEAGGILVASDTELIGNTVYELHGVPVTAGRVVIKAAIRGYDLVTLHPGVALNPAQPIGTIAGIDVDFHALRPITRDVRFLVRSNGGEADSSFPTGARARVYCKETGHSADTVSNNGYGEAWLSEVPTGWPLNFSAYNLNSGWFSATLGPITIPENGGSAFTEILTLE